MANPFQYVDLRMAQQTTAEMVGLFDEANYWSQSRTFVDLKDEYIEHIGVVLSPERMLMAGVAAHVYTDNGNVVFVDSLFTVPDREGTGLGAVLRGQLLDITKVGDDDKVRLTPKAGSVGFYSHLGFVPAEPGSLLGPHQVSAGDLRVRLSLRKAEGKCAQLAVS